MSYPSLSVVNRWCNGEGKFKQRIRIVSSSNETIVETEETPVELPATLANVTAVPYSGTLNLRSLAATGSRFCWTGT